jgi:glutamate dehydrogenase
LQARENLQWHEEFIEEMEREKGLDREIEGLPDSEAIEQRLRLGKGLTRPELCVLLSYAKISLTEELLDSDIPDNPEMQYWLTEYFPTLLHDEFKPEILRHRLKREIIATMMANSLVDRMGPTFLKSRMKKTGAAVEDIVEAYIVVRDSFNLPQIWDDIEALDGKVPAEVQLKAMREVALLSEHAITWFLTRLGRDLDIKTDVIGFGEGVAALQANMDKLVTDGLKDLTVQRTAAILSDGLPKALSRQIALMPVLSSACDIVRISLEQNTDLMNTARTYFELGERFHLDWLRQQARFLPGGDQWETEAAEGLIEHLFSCQAGMTVKILKDMNGALGKGKESKESSIVEKWLEKYKHQVGQLDPVFAELRRSGTVDMAMLTVAEQRLRHLYGG